LRLRRTLSTLIGILGALFIIISVWLFLVFPRVVNQIADVLGNMGYGEPPFNVNMREGVIHAVIALVLSLIIAYFFMWRPTRRLRESFNTPGLVIRKGEGQAFIDTESVRQQVLQAIGSITEIRHADVNVSNDSGKANIQLNIMTDISLNGPKKKNEINREIRKIVQDQLGLEISGKPTIHFSLTPPVPEVPMIAPPPMRESTITGSSPRPSAIPPVDEDDEDEDDVIEMPPPEEEPMQPSRPTGVDLARSDPFAARSSFGGTPAPVAPVPAAPAETVSDSTEILPLPSTQIEPAPDAPPSETTTLTSTSSNDDSKDQLAAEG
jgi:hypothetical protein